MLVNSWESFYFRFTQKDLLRLARQGKELGAELFVLDDGWFGRRDNDRRSLGDWDITDRRKLPEGLGGLAKRVRALGIGFGLWVEPEMVSEDSRLYRAHPDWILGRPGQAVGRNQFILDLSREEVQDHLVRVLSEVFEEAEPAYVKWDMNRVMTDTYSAARAAGGGAAPVYPGAVPGAGRADGAVPKDPLRGLRQRGEPDGSGDAVLYASGLAVG